ncbi:MAG: hypothetical protein J0I12_32305 [Candidatus Eremiobacteraeota bacterium]|nr:hypothetical protein [Candidatus Eremiobacteraeota bacterium]
MQVQPTPPNPYVYRLLAPIVAAQEESTPSVLDRVTLSPQTLARKVPTTLDSLIHFPERLNAVLSVAHGVISFLAGPVGIVLGSLGAVAIPSSVLARRRREANKEP